MKTRHLFVFAAMTALLFAACGDDDEKNNEAVEAAPNTAIVNGRTYRLNSRYEIASEDRSYVMAESAELDAAEMPLLYVRADVDAEGLNRTLDLTKAYEDASYAFGVNNADYSFNIGQDMHGGQPYGSIGDNNFDDGAFQSGTITIGRTDNLFTYKVTGILKTGEPMSFHISVPSSEWSELDW